MSLQNNGIFDPINHELRADDINETKFDNFLENLTDVPSSMPLQPFTIDKAGIVNQDVYVKIRSLFSSQYVSVLCRVSMQVQLVGHRGIHMSRCEEALFQLINNKYENLEDFASELAKEIRKRQDSDVSYVGVEGQYLAKRKTKKSKLTSYDKIYLAAEVCSSRQKTSVKIGLKASNITGCPCTETYTKFSIIPALKKQGFSLEQIKKILNTTKSGTHTQRGLSTIYVDKNSRNVNHKTLYEILDKSCHLIFELLKRPDEHELVLRALTKPQFTEDVVREIVGNTLSVLGNLPDHTRLSATSLLYDSIHIHDVYTKIDRTIGELKKEV